MTTSTFDPQPLTAPVDRLDVREYTRTMRERGYLPRRTVGGVIFTVVSTVIGLAVFAATAAVVPVFVSGVMSGGGWGALLLAVLFALIGLGIVFAFTSAIRGFGVGRRLLRLDRFARANGMDFVPGIADRDLPGMIFRRGDNRQALDVVRGEKPRFVEFANYTFTTGSGKHRVTHRWGYVAVKLDVPLPHIVLDATGNNALFGSNLPALYDRAQRLSLEGDFDEHFALYCPRGYETDALYLFAPDIMARFIDHVAELDVEIVDDWLFLYAKRDLSTLDPDTWGWLFSSVSALLDKLAQWERWRDDRLTPAPSSAAPALVTPPPGVAAPGRRLKGGMPWPALIVFGLVVVGWTFAVTDGWGFLGR